MKITISVDLFGIAKATKQREIPDDSPLAQALRGDPIALLRGLSDLVGDINTIPGAKATISTKEVPHEEVHPDR